MPTINDDYWTNQDSLFFQSISGEENLEEIDPASGLDSHLADTRRILPLIFMLDISGSMRGQRIGMVNYALENLFKQISRNDDPHAIIKVGIMEFEENVHWITPQPVLLENYIFTQLQATQWVTNYAPAFEALNQKLRRSAFMDPKYGEYFAPVILFVTDGEPTDVAEYPQALRKLQQNGWFQQSARYAIAVGEESRSPEVIGVLSQFTGDERNVRWVDEGEALCSLIQFISISASSVQTSMVSKGNSDNDPSKINSSIFDDRDQNLFSSLTDAK